MSTINQTALRIETCPESHRGAALWLATGGAASRMSPGRVAALLAAEKSGKISFDGLLVARRGERIVAAVWIQRQAGNLGTCWGPGRITAESPEICTELLEIGVRWAATQGCRIIQSILEVAPTPIEEDLSHANFRPLAELEYLSGLAERFPTGPPSGRIGLVAYRPEFREQLEKIIQATYRESLDCPELDDLRSIDDVLAGYRAAGDLGEAGWYFVRHEQQIVGCLILAYHQEINQAELVYCGLTPTARGLGLGVELTREALWWANERGADQLVLAVDRRNTPAIQTYVRSGLLTTDHKRLWVRVIDDAR